MRRSSAATAYATSRRSATATTGRSEGRRARASRSARTVTTSRTTPGVLQRGWDADCGYRDDEDGEDCHTTMNGECADGCDGENAATMLAFLSIFVAAGVSVISVGTVGTWLTRQRNQLHQEHGAEAEARCVKRWSAVVGSGDNRTTQLHMTLVYCVPMPQPTAEVQYLKITKDVKVINQLDWKQEGEMLAINHLLKNTGDARNSVIVAEMNRSQCGLAIGLTIFGSIFAAFPLLMLSAAGCGAKMLIYLPIFIGVPVGAKVCGEKKLEKQRANPDGRLEEVDQQGKEMAMAGPIVQQQVMNPTAMMVPQATAVPINGTAVATAVPIAAGQEIASQGPAAGYTPPGASTARAAFALVRGCN